ncbi:MAG TPA: MerR family transcriptional regulator [Actinomycetota bacterium]|nr:MerR family transcriptional regulator [Actinomycetota bacterium]
MRISELSAASGVPIPTIKFYLREGLLAPGVKAGQTQAEYSEAHVRRLRLIRTLLEAGRMRVRDVRTVLRALDDDEVGFHDLLGTAHHALGGSATAPGTPEERDALAEVDRFVSRLGWNVSDEAPARHTLARALFTLREFGYPADVRVFEPYARVADRLAAREISTISGRGPRADAVEAAVVGTVVFEAALVALRRLAQEHHSARRFGGRRRR